MFTVKILQQSLPVKPWADARTRRLPGVGPVSADAWLMIDDAYAAQMAYVDQILAKQRDLVVADTANGQCASRELCDAVIKWCLTQPGFARRGNTIIRPDGVQINLDADIPLVTARRLVQEDLLIHLKTGDEHVLTSGVLAFPASWSLNEKLNRGLRGVHAPVDPYNEGIAKRVQRLFDGLQVGRPLMRANFLQYHDPDLHQPRREDARRDTSMPARFMRVERQCLIRLPVTAAVVFSIHTFVVPMSYLTTEDVEVLDELGASTHDTAG